MSEGFGGRPIGLDVSVIGRGHFSPRGRTGLYRVAVMLVRALLAEKVDVRAYAPVCRGEAELELAHLGLDVPVRRSGTERWLQPWVASMTGASAVGREALPKTLRQRYRTLIQLIEALPGGAAAGLEDTVALFHSPYDAMSHAGLASGAGRPKVITVHDLLPLTHPQWFKADNASHLRSVLDELASGAWAHCVSEYTQGQLCRLVPEAAGRVFVAPLYAEPELFFVPRPEHVIEAKRTLQIEPDRPYLLSLGTLDGRKNQELAVRVFESLSGRYPDLRLVIVGAATAQGAEVQALAKKISDSSGGIIVAGFVPDASLAGLYAGASAFLFPSRAEGFGLPVLEAMQCGAPVIATNATSVPEVAGEGAILRDPDDVDGWVEATESLLRDPTHVEQRRTEGIAQAQRFSAQRFRKAILRGYESML